MARPHIVRVISSPALFMKRAQSGQGMRLFLCRIAARTAANGREWRCRHPDRSGEADKIIQRLQKAEQHAKAYDDNQKETIPLVHGDIRQWPRLGSPWDYP